MEAFLIYKLILLYVFRLRILRTCEAAFAKKLQVNHPHSLQAKVDIKVVSSLKKKNTQEEQSKTKQKTFTLPLYPLLSYFELFFWENRLRLDFHSLLKLVLRRRKKVFIFYFLYTTQPRYFK